MTDAAVVADSAPAPVAPPAGAPINENAPAFNAPLGSQIPPDAVAKPEAPPAPKSIDDSIDRAMARSAEKQAEKAAPPKAEVKPEPAKEAKPEQPRENGKFVAREPAKAAEPAQPAQTAKPAEPVKPSHTAEDAPARFTDTAKAKWHTADPEIRGEVLRMQRELTDGYQKYKTAAERDGTLNEFHEMASQSGTTVKDALTRYTQLEGLLRKDPIGGLAKVCENMGLSLKDVAAHVMGQTPEQNASAQDATIRELRQEIAGLKEQFGGVQQSFQEQRKTATENEVAQFAKDHPRFEELADAIASELKLGFSLSDAYRRAELLNPAPAPAAKEEPPAASSAAPPAPPVQPDKGQKSINGAPSAGSSPGRKRVGKSLDEALEHAFGHAG